MVTTRFNQLLLVFIATVFSNSLLANDDAWLNRSLEILGDSKDKDVSQLLTKPSQDDLEVAKKIAAISKETITQSIKIPEQVNEEATVVYLFASFSMSDSSFDSMLQLTSTQHNARIVIRGMKEGENISGTMRAIQEKLKGIKPQPIVNIDPNLFKQYQVTTVPTMIAVSKGEEILRAQGSISVSWLLEKVDGGATGDIGKYGETYSIEEKDLVEEMKSRLAALDGKEIQKRITDQFWTKYKFTTLTPAQKDKRYEWDPTIKVAEDIMAPNGQYIAKAGQVFNPLNIIAFTKRLVVFNPTRKNEIDYVIALQEKSQKEGRGMILIATEVQRENGWESLKEVQDKFNYPVYLLNKQVSERFNLKHTPTVIVANDKNFVITEKYISSL